MAGEDDRQVAGHGVEKESALCDGSPNGLKSNMLIESNLRINGGDEDPLHALPRELLHDGDAQPHGQRTPAVFPPQRQ